VLGGGGSNIYRLDAVEPLEAIDTKSKIELDEYKRIAVVAMVKQGGWSKPEAQKFVEDKWFC